MIFVIVIYSFVQRLLLQLLVPLTMMLVISIVFQISLYMHVYGNYHNRCVRPHPKYDCTNPTKPVWRKRLEKTNKDTYHQMSKSGVTYVCWDVGEIFTAIVPVICYPLARLTIRSRSATNTHTSPFPINLPYSYSTLTYPILP